MPDETTLPCLSRRPIEQLHASPATQFPTRIDASGAVIALPRTLNLLNRTAFKQLVVDAIADGVRTFALDCRACRFIDGSGFGVLVSVAHKIGLAGGTLELRDLDEDLTALVYRMRLDEVLVLRSTAEAC